MARGIPFAEARRLVIRGFFGQLIDTIGVDHVLFGSDYPHPEGLAHPTSYLDHLPAELHQAFIDDAAAELGDPLVLDYVRLNWDATAA